MHEPQQSASNELFQQALGKPESRQILKAYMTSNSHDRSFHSFSDSRHGRTGQIMVKLM